MSKSIFVVAAATMAVAGAAATAGDYSYDRNLRGTIKIDGSSTVYPITEAVAEEFAGACPKVRVTVGISGTGGGMKRFTVGETDISDASRPIKGKEYKKAVENGVEFIESCEIYHEDRNLFVDKVPVAANQMLHMVDVRITESRRDF